MKKNIFLKSIKDDHADGYTSGFGLIRSILGDLELPSQKNHTFIPIWESWFSYEPPLIYLGPPPTGPEKRKFSITSDSFFYFYYRLFGGRKEANRRGFIQIGPCKLLKGAPKDFFFCELRHVALLK